MRAERKMTKNGRSDLRGGGEMKKSGQTWHESRIENYSRERRPEKG